MRIVPAAMPVRSATSLIASSSATGFETVDSTQSASAPSRQPYGRRACAGHGPGSVGVVRAAATAIAALVAAAYVAIRRLLPDIPDWVRVLRQADDSTTMDPRTGAVRSVQSAEVVLPADRIDALWSPLYLERLARTYWRFLTRATFGMVRVYYTDRERAVCLLVRRFPLLTFHVPEYEM